MVFSLSLFFISVLTAVLDSASTSMPGKWAERGGKLLHCRN
jgi:hypothetical protein